MKHPRWTNTVAAAAMIIALPSCAPLATPYQPLSSLAGVDGGFDERRLSEDRFEVRFAGNSLTSRETVEAYLLYRAAELTLSEGYDWFVVIDKEVDHLREVQPDPSYRPRFATGYSSWKPYWRYYLEHSGWNGWDPYHGDLFWADASHVQTIERFEATTDIKLGRGAPRDPSSNTVDAAEVIARIGPAIVRPGH